MRVRGRVAEGAPLLREYTLIAYRGFESLLLRQIENRITARSYPITLGVEARPR